MASSPSASYDQARAAAFGGRVLDVINHGSLALMISIGHRTGLFDTMRGLRPSTSAEIAAAAGLNERYVREWLGAMVTGGVVDVDEESTRFTLPAEHAASLTRAAGMDNMAAFTQYISVLGMVEDDIVRCFREGGGVPYEKFPRFHAVMAEDSGQSVLSALETHILPLVPGLTERLRQGIRVLDAGCGSGRILNQLANLYPASSFTGLDLSPEAIGSATTDARARGLTNVRFEARDLSDFDATAPPGAYDFITTFDAVHDQAHPLRLLKGVHRALAPDGIYLMQDIKGSSKVRNNLGHPVGTFLYAVSTMHCMTVSLAQGGEGLGAMWGEEKTREYLARAGFATVEKHEPAHDVQNNWYVVRKPRSARIGELLAYLEEERARLRAVVDAVPAPRRDVRVHADRWSVAEILEHLSIVERRIARLIATEIAAGRSEGLGPEHDTSPVMSLLDVSRVANAEQPLTAAGGNQPRAGLDVSRAWEALEISRAALRQALLEGDGLALTDRVQPHPFIGPLNLYQWALFVGAHDARHARQIRALA